MSPPLILVLGGSGQLGRQILRSATTSDRATLRGVSRSHPNPELRFELEEPASIAQLIRRFQPAHVILTAAATNVAWCEEHPVQSRAINVAGPEAVAEAASEIGATVTFISTDYVFDGLAGPYLEDGEPHPINVYGSHKLAAEGAVFRANPGSLVVRSCQVFGDDPRRTNFVLQVVDQLRRGQAVRAAIDLLGTPTCASDLAKAVVELTLLGAKGVWHVAGDVFLSRYELATRVAAIFKCAGDAIVGVRADEMGDVVNRPRLAGLTNGRLTSRGLDFITPLDVALAALAAADEGR